MRGQGSFQAIGLAPLAWVAWADGEVDENERGVVLAQARVAGLRRGSQGYQLLQRWLVAGVPGWVRERWQANVRDLRARLPAHRWSSFRTTLLQLAFEVAEASGGFLTLTTAVSREESLEIRRIREVLDAA